MCDNQRTSHGTACPDARAGRTRCGTTSCSRTAPPAAAAWCPPERADGGGEEGWNRVMVVHSKLGETNPTAPRRRVSPDTHASTRTRTQTRTRAHTATATVTRHVTSWVQGPLTRPGFSTFCHRCRHCTSVRPDRHWAIFFQHLPSNRTTAVLRISSCRAITKGEVRSGAGWGEARGDEGWCRTRKTSITAGCAAWPKHAFRGGPTPPH